MLGDGSLQQDGPEAGLHERATASEVCAYYERVVRTRLLASGKVSFYPNCDYLDDRRFVSRFSGRHHEVRGRPRIVDARYLSPSIPATTPPPYGVAEGVAAVAVNDLVSLGAPASEYVIVGSGKTATDACIWLLDNGVDPGAICWVRSRDPWMLNRAVVQPDPVVFLGTAADIMAAAAGAASADDVFFRLEEAGVMLRIDRSVIPTMAKVPTLAQWELDRLRTIDRLINVNEERMETMSRSRGRVDPYGGSYVVPLPREYYEYKRENDRLKIEREGLVPKLDDFKAKAAQVKQDLPVPTFTGKQQIIETDGTPVALPGKAS